MFYKSYKPKHVEKFMKSILSKITVVLSTTLILFCTSCQIKDEVPATFNYSSEDTSRAALADDVVDGTQNILDNGYDENGGEPNPFRSASLFPSCTTITITINGNGGTIILDFGDSCELNNGAVVSGKITLVYGAVVSGTRTINYTFENYTYNGNGVTGEGEIFREITNDNGNPQSTVNELITVSFPNTDVTATRDGFQVVEWIEGFGSGTWMDNVYEVTGNWDPTFSNGFIRSGEVTQALTKKMSCLYVVSGKLVVEQQGVSAEIDWGNGTCDNLATFTFEGTVYPIILGN